MMEVICRSSISSSGVLVIPRNPLFELSNDNFVASSEWYTINAQLSGYRVTIGRNYKVHGILCLNQEVRYLIFDDKQIPGFFPQSLFDVLNEERKNWVECEYKTQQGVIYLCSYPQLTKSYGTLVEIVDCTNKGILSLLDCLYEQNK